MKKKKKSKRKRKKKKACSEEARTALAHQRGISSARAWRHVRDTRSSIDIGG